VSKNTSRRRNRGAFVLSVGIVVVLMSVLTIVRGTAGASAATDNWSTYLYGPTHSSYNPNDTAITPSNASTIQPTWRWIPPASPNPGSTGIRATPTVVNGIMYVGVRDGYFYAVNMATQSVLWSQFLGLVNGTTCGAGYNGIISTATVEPDPVSGVLTVYVNGPDGYLYALNASTGAVIWQALVGIPSTTINNYYAWGSPLVANGNVYIGVSSECDQPLIPGGVVEVNQSTGATEAQWYSTPTGKVGGSVWSSPALLPDGSIVVTTGNGNGTGQPLYNESVVRLSGSDLAVLDSWQTPAAGRIPDSDFGGSPTLFIATIGGVSTPMVGACNKNGIYYAFAQSSLSTGPVWQQEITAPYTQGGQCDAAAIWNGTQLIEAGNTSTINGVTDQGSIQSLNPATGKPMWQTGLPGGVIGTPTEDGAGVIAAQVFADTTDNFGVYLINASNGNILGYIPTYNSPLFSQPIFVNNQLLVSGIPTIGVTAYTVPVPGPTITGISPSTLHENESQTLTITGTGFSSTPTVFVSNTGVTVKSVDVVNSTTLQVTVATRSTTLLGSRNVTVVEPGPTIGYCSACLTVGPPPPAPTGVSPNDVAQGQISTVTVTGSNFEPGAKVTNANGITAQTTYVSSTELTAVLKVPSSVSTGSYNVAVLNPDGGSRKCSSCLTVTADPSPTITTVSPTAVGQHGMDTLTITGTGFTLAPTVTFSNSGLKPWSVKYVNSQTLSVVVAVSNSAPLAPSDVIVTTPGGSVTCSGCLTIDAAPKITSITPQPAVGATTPVTVNGSGFQSGLVVTSTVPGATFGAVSGQTATTFGVSITIPGSTTAGTYTLTVTNPDGGKVTHNITVT
jgi:polyvinyl alcohol dehydrogenase (cytochrome)